MSEQELNLFQFTAVVMAQFRAGSPQIVGRKESGGLRARKQFAVRDVDVGVDVAFDVETVRARFARAGRGAERGEV